MFSKRFVFLILAVFVVLANLVYLAVGSKGGVPVSRLERLTIALVAPFQMAVTRTTDAVQDVWAVYFASVSAARENKMLKKALALATADQNRCRELALENQRLRKFIYFKQAEAQIMVAAKVIARDPSPWFSTMMIDKGNQDGLCKGLPVVAAQGIVGQVVAVAGRYSRVLLITDRNSSVDALVQSTRARGIVQGDNTETCFFDYALRKETVTVGDDIVASGLDQIFPKGVSIGKVVDVKKENSDLFQHVRVKTSVDFNTLEEVLVFVKQTGPTEDVRP
ncbi:rod shape-determining protein MreC [Desulfocicer vacuolatum DSM 3385]|uniref:Cell shape-determining protein MreC n=1 Tax=Desulfocicer vacuolatum DSM 3385 TaxID=1121400 RepID=A0A1W1YZT6_9BACT|nr:rod shape-determining protein MreC [Desulfocicer vacuolatum]SMC41646.1 rod shape-determining protein MreC [Desulfocicer vacuolatum DSM 3385]